MDFAERGLRIDLGCGSAKKEGTIGIDLQAWPGVDLVQDVVADPLPFKDRSVEYVYSAHFLEHLRDLGPLFREITRVCATDARLELWTPYAWSNLAFILDHKQFLTEDVYLQIGVLFHEFWTKELGARWVLDELLYVVEPETLMRIEAQGMSLEFALRHLQNVVAEFAAYFTVRPSRVAPDHEVKRTWAFTRDGRRHPLRRHGRQLLPLSVRGVIATAEKLYRDVGAALRGARGIAPK